MNINNEDDIQDSNIQDNNTKDNINNNKKKTRKEIKEEKSKEKKKNNKKKAIYLVLFIIIFLIAGIGILKVWQSRNENNYWLDKLAKNGIMEGRTLEEIQDILNQTVEEGMFNVSINPDPIFEDGADEGNIAIENIPSNHYYTRVTITLNDTGEVVFKSGGIKPSQYIDYIKLDKDLPKGDYPATALFEIADPETLAEIGRVNVDLNIHILN